MALSYSTYTLTEEEICLKELNDWWNNSPAKTKNSQSLNFATSTLDLDSNNPILCLHIKCFKEEIVKKFLRLKLCYFLIEKINYILNKYNTFLTIHICFDDALYEYNYDLGEDKYVFKECVNYGK